MSYFYEFGMYVYENYILFFFIEGGLIIFGVLYCGLCYVLGWIKRFKIVKDFVFGVNKKGI